MANTAVPKNQRLLDQAESTITKSELDAAKYIKKLKLLRIEFAANDSKIQKQKQSTAKGYKLIKNPYTTTKPHPEIELDPLPEKCTTTKDYIAALKFYDKYMPILVEAVQRYERAIQRQNNLIMEQEQAIPHEIKSVRFDKIHYICS